MTERSTTQHPTAPPDTDAYLARFGWHPEPELVGYRDEGASRAALERLGEDTWRAALDFLYDHAVERAMGDPGSYDEIREAFFGARRSPGPAPDAPTPSAEILEQFRTRLAGGQMNAQHARQFGYFTPPPLPISMMGELLAQMTNQGVDVWHAGPVAAFVEEEVVRWLCDLVGYGDASFGLLTSGGVMANFMGMTIARDLRLGRVLGPRRRRRAAPTSSAHGCTPAIRPTSPSRGRWTCSASRPRRWSSSRLTNGSACAARRSPRPSRATGRPA